jgi:hypothetical protein
MTDNPLKALIESQKAKIQALRFRMAAKPDSFVQVELSHQRDLLKVLQVASEHCNYEANKVLHQPILAVYEPATPAILTPKN